SPLRRIATAFWNGSAPCSTSSSPVNTTNSPRASSPWRITSVPGASSWPLKRRARSKRCSGEEARNSREVAGNILSRRARVARAVAGEAAGRLREARQLAGKIAQRRAAQLDGVDFGDRLDGDRTRLRGHERHLAEHRALAEASDLVHVGLAELLRRAARVDA